MNRIWLRIFILGIFLWVVLTGCSPDQSSQPNRKNSPEILVSAAASLNDSLTEIRALYNQQNPQVKVTLNFGGSGTLQQQIEQGAPADVFISAGKAQFEALIEKKLLIEESSINLVGNELVLITQKDNNDLQSVQDLSKPSVKQIGIGTPESVPAGKYAQESLTALKLWDSLNPKFIQAKDVTQVLNYVETGNVEAGIVYQSDAQTSTQVKVVEVLPSSSHEPILYPAGIVTATKNQEAAQEFLTFLQSSEAQDIFVKYGFQAMKK